MAVSSLLGLGTSGMMSQTQGMDVIGNNIANTQTAGFKSGTMTYADLWHPNGVARANGLQLQSGYGVEASGAYYDWTPGHTESTGVMTHLAIQGDGFIPVQVDGQTMYTRAGDFAFTENPDGAGDYVLMRPNGDVLLDSTGAVITFADIPADLTISRGGEMTADGAPVAQVGIQTFANPDTLQHNGNGVYTVTPATVLSNAMDTDLPGSPGVGYIQTGALEQSNVDLIREFTQMIATQRAFQASSKTVRTADEMLQEILQLKR
jgi:flagellar hook protein FlgE